MLHRVACFQYTEDSNTEMKCVTAKFKDYPLISFIIHKSDKSISQDRAPVHNRTRKLQIIK
jgi:hypothetical protein